MNLRVFVIAGLVCVISFGVLLSMCSSDEKSATAPAAEAPCEQYTNRILHDRFVVLECLFDSASYGTAYVYDPVRKKCFLLHSGGHSLTLTDVTCDNLPVPE